MIEETCVSCGKSFDPILGHSLEECAARLFVGERPAFPEKPALRTVRRTSKKKIYAVCWTWKQFKLVSTKGEGREMIRDWVADKRESGWAVQTFGTDTYLARLGDEKHVVALHEYDAMTKERIWELPKAKKVAA